MTTYEIVPCEAARFIRLTTEWPQGSPGHPASIDDYIREPAYRGVLVCIETNARGDVREVTVDCRHIVAWFKASDDL